MAAQVEEHYRRILESKDANLHRTLELGYRAASSLLELIPGAYRRSQASLGRVLMEIPGQAESRPSGKTEIRQRGTAAQRLGVLLLMGAVVRAMRSDEGAGSAPILLIEDPEAHLHPMTVASVWGILEEIQLHEIVATHSGTLLASASLSTLRRLVRSGGLHKKRPCG
jgi:putative ATP-dependent endonuclease of OLD family